MMEETILDIVKARLNRLPEETALDEYLTLRIRAAVEELTERGIHVQETVRDMMLVGDIVAWRYGNRDKTESMPDWLRVSIRDRWMAEWRA